MTDVEQVLSEHLRHRADEATPHPQLAVFEPDAGQPDANDDVITLRFTPAAPRQPGADRDRVWGRSMLAAAAILVVASIGAFVALGSRSTPSATPGVGDTAGPSNSADPTDRGSAIFEATTGTEEPLFDYAVSGRGSGPAVIDSVDDAEVCVTIRRADETSSGCYNAATVRTGLAYLLLGTPDQGYLAVGVVPDQVDTVTLGGTPVAVIDNVWSVELSDATSAELRVGDSRTQTFATSAPAADGLELVPSTTIADVPDEGDGDTRWDEGIATIDVTISLDELDGELRSGSEGPRPEIDRGHDDGIVIGMPVVDRAGLIGKITAVTDDTSAILELTDPDFAVEVDVSPAYVSLWAVGTGDDTLILRGSARLTSADIGKVIFTSGRESTLPAGIPIGTITSIETAPTPGSDVLATVTPFATAGHLKSANVMRFTPDEP